MAQHEQKTHTYIVLSIKDGFGFSRLSKKPLGILAVLQNKTLMSDYIFPYGEPIFNCNFTWRLENKELLRLRKSNAKILLEVRALEGFNKEITVGFTEVSIALAEFVAEESQWPRYIGLELHCIKPKFTFTTITPMIFVCLTQQTVLRLRADEQCLSHDFGIPKEIRKSSKSVHNYSTSTDKNDCNNIKQINLKKKIDKNKEDTNSKKVVTSASNREGTQKSLFERNSITKDVQRLCKIQKQLEETRNKITTCFEKISKVHEQQQTFRKKIAKEPVKSKIQKKETIAANTCDCIKTTGGGKVQNVTKLTSEQSPEILNRVNVTAENSSKKINQTSSETTQGYAQSSKLTCMPVPMVLPPCERCHKFVNYCCATSVLCNDKITYLCKDCYIKKLQCEIKATKHNCNIELFKLQCKLKSIKEEYENYVANSISKKEYNRLAALQHNLTRLYTDVKSENEYIYRNFSKMLSEIVKEGIKDIMKQK